MVLGKNKVGKIKPFLTILSLVTCKRQCEVIYCAAASTVAQPNERQDS